MRRACRAPTHQSSDQLTASSLIAGIIGVILPGVFDVIFHSSRRSSSSFTARPYRLKHWSSTPGRSPRGCSRGLTARPRARVPRHLPSEVTVGAHRVLGPQPRLGDQNGSVNFLKSKFFQLLNGVNIDVTACGDLNKPFAARRRRRRAPWLVTSEITPMIPPSFSEAHPGT